MTLRRVAEVTLVCAAFAVALTVLQNVVVARALAHLPRLTTDFSATYLRRHLSAVARGPAPTLVLGDSVLWGYRVDPSQSAASLLTARGCTCVNLSFKGSSPPNYYAMLRLALDEGVKPRALLVEIDDKVFNPEDNAYATLNPSLASDVASLPDAADVAALSPAPPVAGPWAPLDRALSSVWLLYAMKGDVRETVFGDTDAAVVVKPTPDLYEGTYDLTPLAEDNTGVRFLEKTMDLAKARGIAVVAFLNPTNHRLLHDYIDAPEYRANLAYLERLARRHGASVLDLDDRFPTDEFLDNSHLTPAGQVRLAAYLAPQLALTK